MKPIRLFWRRAMKLRTLSVAAALAATLVMPNFVLAQDEEEKSWSLDLAVDYADTYVFRGVNLLGDEGVLQPHAALGIGNFNIWYWGYFGDQPDSNRKYNENDFGVDYTFAIGDKVSLTAGALTYIYDKDVEEGLGFLDTYEWYVVASLDVPLSPTISYYRDFDEVDGGYLSIGVSHGWELGKISPTVSLSAGFDFHYNNKDASNGEFNDILIGLDLPWQITDAFSLHVLGQHSLAQKAIEDFQDDETVVTVGGAYSF